MTEHQKMNSELKAKWLEALRSGRYRQCKQVLKNKDEAYCCLGVCCDIIDNTNWKQYVGCDGRFSYEFKEETSGATLPYTVMEFAGLKDDTCAQLAKMNDYYDKDFNAIADWIQENL